MSWPVEERGEDLSDMPPEINWKRWRKCPVCGAKRGEACWVRTGGGPEGRDPVPLGRTHLFRRPTTRWNTRA